MFIAIYSPFQYITTASYRCLVAYVTMGPLLKPQDCCMGNLYAKNFAPNRCSDHTMARNLDNGEFCRVDRMNIE